MANEGILLQNITFRYGLKMFPRIELKAIFHDLPNNHKFSPAELKAMGFILCNAEGEYEAKKILLIDICYNDDELGQHYYKMVFAHL